MQKTQNALNLSLVPSPIRTPLLYDNRICIKPEGVQHGGSVKYRMVYEKIRKALSKGDINPQTTLTEATSGSTGVSLAYIGQKLGLTVEIHAYETINTHKRSLIEENYKARLILHPKEVPVSDILTLVSSKVSKDGYWHLNQYNRESNMQAYQTLGHEIAEQLHSYSRLPKKFVCPVGTGGLIQGVGTYLRKAIPKIEIIAVEPAPGEKIDGIRNTQCHHMGKEDPYDRAFPDQTFTVPAPKSNIAIEYFFLGESASAVFELIQKEGWDDVFFIAPD